jgi:hypothetical protein
MVLTDTILRLIGRVTAYCQYRIGEGRVVQMLHRQEAEEMDARRQTAAVASTDVEFMHFFDRPVQVGALQPAMGLKAGISCQPTPPTEQLEPTDGGYGPLKESQIGL